MSSVATTTITDPVAIAAVNRGPLTSNFTPPSSCLSTLTYNSVMYFGHQGPAYFDPSCFPIITTSSAQSSGPSTTQQYGLYYYSPGQCPLGWSHATTFTSFFPGKTTNPLSLGPDTTAIVCCPSGYEYPSDGYGHQCLSSATDTTLLFFSPTIFENSLVPGSVQTTSIGTDVYSIYGDGIPVWWQSGDLSLFTATTSPSTSRPTSSSTATSTSTLSPSPSSPSDASTGLSEGAKVAIGVSIPVAFIALLLSIFCCLRRRQQRLRHQPIPQREGEELPAGHRDRDTALKDLPAEPGRIRELSSERPAAELPAAHNFSMDNGDSEVYRHELEDTNYR